jgi:hypothetical protein
VQISLIRTETHETYSVADATPMRDPSRCPFQPEEVTIIHRDTPWWVGVQGKRTTSGRSTSIGYRIDGNGGIEPHYRLGAAPQWLTDLVAESDPTRLAPDTYHPA